MDNNKLEDRKSSVTTSRKGQSYKYFAPAPGIHVYENVWDNGFNFVKKLDDEGSFVREDYLYDADGNEIDPAVGKRGVSTWVTKTLEEKDNEICNALEDVIDSYLWHYDLDPKSREYWRISKYKEGDYFGMHPDDSFGTPRTVSIVYYPNDDYEGGELEFIHFGVKLKPKANQLFIFPSSYIYEHKIHDIGSGNPRYTIVAFFCNITEKERKERLSKIPYPYKANLKYIRELEG